MSRDRGMIVGLQIVLIGLAMLAWGVPDDLPYWRLFVGGCFIGAVILLEKAISARED